MFYNRPNGAKNWRSGNNFESFEEIEGKLGFICRTIHAQRVINRHAADINPSGISDQPSGCNFTHHDKYTSTRGNTQIIFYSMLKSDRPKSDTFLKFSRNFV